MWTLGRRPCPTLLRLPLPGFWASSLLRCKGLPVFVAVASELTSIRARPSRGGALTCAHAPGAPFLPRPPGARMDVSGSWRTCQAASCPKPRLVSADPPELGVFAETGPWLRALGQGFPKTGSGLDGAEPEACACPMGSST